MKVLTECFMKGNVKEAIDYMRSNPAFQDFVPAYVDLFEKQHYLEYDVPECLNEVLRAYQVYYHRIFYLQTEKAEAEKALFKTLREIVSLPEVEDKEPAEELQKLFTANGFFSLFGKTQGVYGPYVWKETEPVSYEVELPGGTTKYTVNILRGFVFRSWMDYLTFGQFGTSGWASSDGTINCIEKAHDFESEKFKISLLKHEAQHVEDLKKYVDITAEELEYRAKLVELHYSENPGLLQKFLSEAIESKTDDSHAMASVRIRNGYEKVDTDNIEAVQKRALELLTECDEELAKRQM